MIIAPHAGYAYSGPTAAWAYRSLDLSRAKRVFLLGPSHHFYLSGCALSRHSFYETPLGNLKIDESTVEELYKTAKFEWMSSRTDDDEHSLEMHLPYIYKVLSRNFPKPDTFPPLIPILVGSTSATTEQTYGQLLAPYLADPSSIFIISSDFCHWGSRFHYTYYLPNLTTADTDPASGLALKPRDKPPANPTIYQSITNLDHLVMRAIESRRHAALVDILRQTGNTVCGRHPIGVVMAAMEVLLLRNHHDDHDEAENHNDHHARFRFLKYEQSSRCTDVRDSSVSYVSGFAVL